MLLGCCWVDKSEILKNIDHSLQKLKEEKHTSRPIQNMGQMHVKWQTFENRPENKRQMYDQAWVDPLPYNCLLFSAFSNVRPFHLPRALKLGCITNVDMLLLAMGFICLFYKNKFMLISGSHTCISNRSVGATGWYEVISQMKWVIYIQYLLGQDTTRANEVVLWGNNSGN